MASVNRVTLLGNLGRDPETRYLNNGDAVTNISIATSEKWKDKNGEKQEKTTWHNVVFFGRLAEVASEYLQKGSQVYVEGSIHTRKYIDKDGIDRYVTDIKASSMQLLGGRPDSTRQQPQNTKSREDDFDADIPDSTRQQPQNTKSREDDFDADIPDSTRQQPQNTKSREDDFDADIPF